MDVTQDTVDAANLLSGETATKNSGAKVTGAYTPPTFSTQSKTVSPSTTSQTVQPDSGYDGLSSVTVNAMPSGTAGTPTATKGTVSNHAVSVTPSVTNTTGYITGGTKTGAAVSVSASELVSGTLTISSGGTKDVTNYASASVAAGSATTPTTSITANPSISVSSGGLITATASASQIVTPTVSEGYVTEGTAGTVTVSGSNTQQLTTQAAQTITPTTTNQTIASGQYLSGTQTILGDANLLAENIKKDVSIFNVVGTLESGGGEDAFTWEEYSATPSSTTSITFSGVTKEPNVLGVYMRTNNYSYTDAPGNCLLSLFLVKKGTAARPFYAVPIKKVNATTINAGYTGSSSGNIMATACRVVFDDTLSTLTVTLNNTSYLGKFDTDSTYYLAWIC